MINQKPFFAECSCIQMARIHKAKFCSWSSRKWKKNGHEIPPATQEARASSQTQIEEQDLCTAWATRQEAFQIHWYAHWWWTRASLGRHERTDDMVNGHDGAFFLGGCTREIADGAM